MCAFSLSIPATNSGVNPMDEKFEEWWKDHEFDGPSYSRDIARAAFEAGYYKCEQEHFP
jgi:hypothetical protein